MGDDDDIDYDDEVKIITENFEKQPSSIKHNILRNLKDRPILKKKPLKDNRAIAPIEDPHRHSCSNTYELGLVPQIFMNQQDINRMQTKKLFIFIYE
uniref:Uncharacterized protein n=1 Tax=Lactuca sativa TaxID=4236 RepID=A0A9R1XP35_LACSA|nr:hypothetical protein LSAT_V11C200064450 [Lactuca sativa]